MTKGEHQSKRMCDERPPSSKTMRYDRQLRLWGDEGQLELETATVCLLNATTLGCEILKNLVLPGIGEIHIVDNKLVDEMDVQTNFFLTPNDLGSSRGECVIKTLAQLNPDTKQAVHTTSVPEFVSTHMDTIKRYSVCIVSNLELAQYRDLAQIAWDSHIPLILANIVGMFTEIRVVVKEHCVIESKPDSPLPDLRLDKPFTELIDFYQNVDLRLFTDTEHAHVPYLVLLLKCLDVWRAQHDGEIPKNYSEKKEFKTLINQGRRGRDEENFREACSNVNRCVAPSTLPPTTKELFEDPSAVLTGASSPFWVATAAVKQFHSVRGVLPVSGVLEDLTADSASFIALQNLYRAKARSDAQEVAGYVAESLRRLGLPKDSLSMEYICKFSKNARFIRVVKTNPVECNSDIVKGALETCYEPDDLSHIPVLFQACQDFVARHSRYPGDIDSNIPRDEAELTELLKSRQQYYGLPAITPTMFIKDFVRYGGTEVPSVAAFSGGIAAHECIKLITCQYVPVDSCFVYNGGSQLTAVYKF